MYCPRNNPFKILAPGTQRKSSPYSTHTCPWGRPIMLPGHHPTTVRHKQQVHNTYWFLVSLISKFPALTISIYNIAINILPYFCSRFLKASVPLLKLCLLPRPTFSTPKSGPWEEILEAPSGTQHLAPVGMVICFLVSNQQ